MSGLAQLSVLPVDERRHAPRRTVNFAAALRQAGATTSNALIHNVGAGGCKVESDAPVSVGDEVWLKFPGMEAKRSKVVWVDPPMLGCQFASPLYAAELESIAPADQPLMAKGQFKRL
jgi:hypothetical protein